MEIKSGDTLNSGPKKVLLWPVYLCFIVFGMLIPVTRPDFQVVTFLFSVLLSLVVGLLVIKLLIMLFNIANPKLRLDTCEFAREAVGTGMLFMVPFAVLAVLAKVLMGWNAIMPFASAAIMTSAATAGTEVIKKGAQDMKNMIIPSVLAFTISTLWMMLIGFLP
ncbi:MAG: hypothetical protein K9L17_00940 [Clostridiales bacterium]|nr:hypothetical protein [Clostridiales bacterium]MCF8021258.1 hypothetical protein [Clostridiales bacterium]